MVTVEEERTNLEYQKTMNLYIENISSTSQQIWRSIYEIIHDDYFKAVKLFPTKCLSHCLKKMNLKTYQMHSKHLLKNMALEKGFYAQVVVIRRRNLDDLKEKYKKKI